MKNHVFRMLFCTFALLLARTLQAADSAEGFWKIIDDETGRLRSIIAVYPYQGRLYGRLIITFDEQEKPKDTIYAQKTRAEKLPDKPYMAGLDIIWNMEKDTAKQRWHKGKILDPKKGKVYSSEITWDAQSQRLVVRGKIGPFGRNQYWIKAVDKDFPEGFVLPDTKQWVPEIPRT
ncbi:MAG: DUF2147 domain-containing protein [Lentisphaeria bacterium]